ncbi:MAG: MBL fold metallo-hydrolase [Syntrophobacteraceae bacterium]|nr:MBL fold metallo-hydrolase [Syntrophobacteraceae bacterium]
MVEEVLANLYRIEIPLPGSPLGRVNSYVVKDAKRNLIIDTGLNRKECLEAMLAGLDEIGVELKRSDFYITHLHADHFALARFLSDDNTKVYMNEPDKTYIENWTSWEPVEKFYRLNGFPSDEVDAAIRNHPGEKYGSDRIPVMSAVKDGDIISCGGFDFTAVATPGHTPGHMCLYEPAKKFLLSGDHILIDITPNIGCWMDGIDPLRLYLESLEKVYAMQVELVLPGHRRLVTDCKGRITELRRHHLERLAEVLAILESGPQTGYQTASRMSWDIDCSSWADFPVPQKWFATSEAIAHLRYLEEEGKIVRSEHNGCRFYSRAPKPV